MDHFVTEPTGKRWFGASGCQDASAPPFLEPKAVIVSTGLAPIGMRVVGSLEVYPDFCDTSWNLPPFHGVEGLWG